jgi:hypothetical protein
MDILYVTKSVANTNLKRGVLQAKLEPSFPRNNFSSLSNYLKRTSNQ